MNRKQRRADGKPGNPTAQGPSAGIAATFSDALRHHQAGHLADAERLYRRILQIDARHADSLHLLGVIAYQVGRHERAVDLIGKAIAIHSRAAAYHSNLGNAFQGLGRIDDAIASFRKAIALLPDFPEAANNLGNALLDRGRLNQAVDALERAIALKPDYPEALSNLGNALRHCGRPDEAAASCRRAIALRPDHAEAYSNLGIALMGRRPLAAVIACYKTAIALKPDYAQAHNNLGSAFRSQGRLDEAALGFRRATDIAPDFAEAHNNLGTVHQDQGDLGQALACFRRALARAPDFAEAHSNLLMILHYSAEHGSADLLAEARQCVRRIAAATPRRAFAGTPDPQRRLRIGYVSADLHTHPVGYFLARVLAAHDPGQSDVICYSNSLSDDALTTRLRAMTSGWRSIVGMSDADAGAMIGGDGIDILVDLSGHTAHNRLALFAAKPAPVQVTWLGYYGTTGLSAMDYILADRYVVPPGEEAFFTETVWRLPDSYLCFAPPEIDVPLARRPLTEGRRLTLGSFNNWVKVSPGTIALWAAILARLPEAQLFLKTKSLTDPAVRRDAMARFAAHGIGPDRLVLEGPAPRAELLAAYNRVDIALDPFPNGGGTTTAEALWMGTPVVTLKGDRWVGRVAESILATVGLADLVAADGDGYIATVVGLAKDPARLAALHRDLRGMVEGSAFCDGPRFAKSLDAAYREMWKNWCERRATEER